jgi:hypothetical protein
MPKESSMDVKSFFETDFQWTLFPMKTNLIVIKNSSKELDEYIVRILSENAEDVNYSFLPQTRVYAAKPKNHLRRTVILDPVASYFLYDLVLRNKSIFGAGDAEGRKSFGYRFEGDQPIPVHKAYQEFHNTVDGMMWECKHRISFDVASYFNSIYHHDAASWFASMPGVTGADTQAFGRFFREINAGRSVDFLPQGIYPTKMIGSEFLRFIESSRQIKCKQSVRFMDDVYLFDDDLGVLLRDFHKIQELLGIRSLDVNPTKTIIGREDYSVQQAASAIQAELSTIVDYRGRPGYLGSGAEPYCSDDDADADEDSDDEDTEHEDGEQDLDEDQVERLLALLLDARADENDVEIILGILRDHTDSVAEHVPSLFARFPNIVKQLYGLIGLVEEKELLSEQLFGVLDSNPYLIEYQLFWMAVIAEDHLKDTKGFGKLVMRLHERSSQYPIAQAKVLEIPDQSFGLKEIREEVLKSGGSHWLTWASAIGTRTLKKAARNHALKYFAKGSPINHLIATCVERL